MDRIRSRTEGGVEYAFETAGVVQAMQTAYQITRRGGTTVTSGLPHPKEQLFIPHVTLAPRNDGQGILYRKLCSAPGTSPLHRAIQTGPIARGPPIDRHPALEDINEGFDRLARGQRPA